MIETGPPPLPAQAYGRVYIGGSLAPAGKLVVVKVGDRIVSCSSDNQRTQGGVVTDSQGRYGYDTANNKLLLIMGHHEYWPWGANDGDVLAFYVDGVLATTDVAIYEWGGFYQRDLQVSGLPSGFTRGSVHVAHIALRNPTGTAWNYQVNLLIGSTTVMTKTQQVSGGATVQIEGNVTMPSAGTFAVTAHVIEASLGIDLGSFNLGTVTII